MSSLDLQEPKNEKQAAKGGVPAKTDAKKVGALQNLSRSDANLLSRSVVLEETDPPGGLRATLMTISAFVLVFVVWASLAEFDEHAVAEGEIIPVQGAQEVQHLEGGTIAYLGTPEQEENGLFIEEAGAVEAGDVIIKMDDTAVSAEVNALKARVASLGAQAERLRAFAAYRQPDFSPWSSPEYADIVASQQNAFDTASTTRNALISGLNAQINARREEITGLQATLESLEKQTAAAEEELTMRADLFDRGLNNKVVLLDVQRRFDKLSGDTAQTFADVARARASLAEAQSRRVELADELSKRANEELSQVDGELAVQRNRLLKLEDEWERTWVRAPIDGRISGLLFNKPGAVVKPGAILLSVVPQQREFLADIRIPASDIGHVEVGMDALIKVSTYRFGRKGGLRGKVSRISPDSFEDEDGKRYFRARVAIDGEFVGRSQDNPISSGMTVTASIKTGQKSLMAYLLRPITVSFDNAFAER